jgi:hypothetical protein
MWTGVGPPLTQHAVCEEWVGPGISLTRSQVMGTFLEALHLYIYKNRGRKEIKIQVDKEKDK